MRIGKATYKKGQLHFDSNGWTMVTDAAKKSHKTPTQIVHAALWRYIKQHEKDQKGQGRKA